MSYIHNVNLTDAPFYFAYKRKNDKPDYYEGTFHAHQGLELLIIHEGTGTLIVEQKSYTLAPGMICIFQPYQLHHVQVELSPDTPFIRSIVHYEPTLYEGYLERWPSLLAFYKHIHMGSLTESCIYTAEEAEPLDYLLRSWEQTLPSMSKSDYYEEFSLFLIAFLRAFRPMWEQRQKSSSAKTPLRLPHQAERILEWLQLHYKEPLRLEQMASELHLSPHHLSHLFKACTGSSISDYIAAKKIQQAILLLTSSNFSISRIGEEIGLTNSSYFCKLFKSQLGITPHQYRKQFRSKRYPMPT
ncbi:AraC family transcriptional regulator [Paenibacillus sinopodophylli]|uniref:AraC family transcriptional regulator n=1 Tax=Paenibacillus sinopodophylli TaxID=1837342 RepID=UPI00110CAA17|nr:AraC family transcriptional regulator [Paenibacillus sinopodophylli]